jgi:3-oxoadipate enol-lactonase
MSGNESAPAPTSYLTLRGNRFAYSSEGAGPVVVSAHGLTSSRANDRRMGLLDFAPVASHGHQLISYDARGHGQSDGTLTSADYTWAALSLDLLAFVDHFSPDAPVSAIGSSMGTGTLLHAATNAPDRFDRLVLTAPPTAWETRSQQGAVYLMMADFVETSSPEALGEMSGQAPLPPVFADLEGGLPLPDVAFALLPTIFRGAATTDFPDLQAIAGLTLPTLILAWAGDPGHPVSTAEKLAATIPGSQLHVSDTSADVRTWGDRAAAFLDS